MNKPLQRSYIRLLTSRIETKGLDHSSVGRDTWEKYGARKWREARRGGRSIELDEAYLLASAAGEPFLELLALAISEMKKDAAES